MNDSCKELLKMVYDHCQSSSAPFQIRADSHDSATRRDDVRCLKERGLVYEPRPILNVYSLCITEKGEQFVENGFKSPSSNPSNAIFNIENATNSVIGTQANVTMNINNSIQEAKEQIAASDSSDKEELQQIIHLLEMIVNDQMPAQKGVLSKFSSIIQRNAWITSPISSILLNWLLSQVP